MNWDDGSDKNGKPYNFEFINRYGHISHGDVPVSDKPSTPAGLVSTEQTDSTISLKWAASSGINPISYYTIYRDGEIILNSVETLIYIDSNLSPDTVYLYQISATDTAGNTSSLSSTLSVKTQGGQSSIEEWQIGKSYQIGDLVSYKELEYSCIQAHTSNSEWTPALATTLWKLVV